MKNQPIKQILKKQIRDRSDRDEHDLSTRDIKTILDSCPAAIGIVKDRVLTWTNGTFYNLFGYEPGSLNGKNTRIFYSDQKEYERAGTALYSNVDRYGNGLVETKLIGKDGKSVDCRIRASSLSKENPSRGSIIVITDISELKLSQAQLQQAQKMEAIGILAGGISHDFNNILMGIQGHLSLMQIDFSDTEKIKNHSRHIQALVKTAAELTGRLLGFARGGKYQVSVININELVRLALKIFRPNRKDIRIHETYDKNLHSVDGDQSQIEQVFINLLANASQAMPHPGNIAVTTQNLFIGQDHDFPFEIISGEYVKVTIKDSGMGMDKKTQEKIFDPFFSTKEPGDKKGRGLGLSTVFGIIKNHGGFILVDSRKGEGTCFSICLPASNAIRIKEIHPLPLPFEQIQKGSETILLVDDEDEIVNIGKNFLDKLGYKPMIARNGFEAVEIFKLYKNEISLVILDLIMPVMDGKQAFAEIKAIQKDAKILISTGYSIDDQIESFLNKECHGFIQKPFSLNEFAGALRQILDKPL